MKKLFVLILAVLAAYQPCKAMDKAKEVAGNVPVLAAKAVSMVPPKWAAGAAGAAALYAASPYLLEAYKRRIELKDFNDLEALAYSDGPYSTLKNSAEALHLTRAQALAQREGAEQQALEVQAQQAHGQEPEQTVARRAVANNILYQLMKKAGYAAQHRNYEELSQDASFQENLRTLLSDLEGDYLALRSLKNRYETDALEDTHGNIEGFEFTKARIAELTGNRKDKKELNYVRAVILENAYQAASRLVRESIVPEEDPAVTGWRRYLPSFGVGAGLGAAGMYALKRYGEGSGVAEVAGNAVAQSADVIK